MNQTNLRVLIGLLIAVTISLGAWGVYANQSDGTDSAGTAVEAEVTRAPEVGRTEITYLAEPGITSLDQLRREAADVIVSESEYGELVDSVEGHKNGTDGAYWSFYVNGEMAQVGAGDYTQEEGDFIEWKFQKF